MPSSPTIRAFARLFPDAKPIVGIAASMAMGLSLTACLDRPIGLDGPRTTSLITERLRQAPPTKLDLLLVVDNSASMSDKQVVLAEALPDLIRNLVLPPCVSPDGQRQERTTETPCPNGTVPEFEPLSDLQVGIITTSLGGYGAEGEITCQNEESTDMAHLLPTRPRASHVASSTGVLPWKVGQPLGAFIDSVSEVVRLAGDTGCGFESGLEAWYRFLIDPAPYTELVRVKCGASGKEDCVTRKPGLDGNPEIDSAVLQQRQAFLRPDSLVAIVMLSDENDCSFREHPSSWVLTDSARTVRAAAACEADPNDRCCQSCGVAPNAECPFEVNDEGQTVALGCAAGEGLFDQDDPRDHPNLRCFEQKRRYGIDMLHPTDRYIRALRETSLCPKSASGDPSACAPDELLPNPLYAGAGSFARTKSDDVFLVGIVGVPWQDVAASPLSTDPLVYLPTVATPGQPGVNWAWLLPSNNAQPDPLMRESVAPRQGTNPATLTNLAPPDAARLANPINGHEHANPMHSELEYACVFPLNTPRICTDPAEQGHNCDCDSAGGNVEGNPLCQAPDNSFGETQYFAKAYPGLRQLEVLQGVGESAVVASICAKDTQNPSAADYGYRPAMHAIVDRIKSKLADVCYSRQLSTDDNGATCRVVEVLADPTAGCSCEGTRGVPSDTVLSSVRQQMREQGMCTNAQECQTFCACEVEQVAPAPDGQLNSCQTDANSTDNGWCYVDAADGVASAQLVANCQESAPRKVRFVGSGVPQERSMTFLACQGLAYDD